MKSKNPAKVLEFLNTKWKGGVTCPMCGGVNFEVQDHVFQLIEFNEGNMVIGGPVIPVIPVTCGNCGNTVLINAIKAGALVPPSQSAKVK